MILEGSIPLGLNRVSQVVQYGHCYAYNMAVHAQNHHSVLAWLIKIEVRVTACIEVLYDKLFE